MSRVVVQLPRVLTDLVGCESRIPVEGATVHEALRDLVARHPELDVHLFDEGAALRRHVLCFWNETQTRERAALDEPTRDGDRITIVNSVAGG